MNDEKPSAQFQAFEAVAQFRLDALMLELTKRVRVVNDDALNHLVEQGVIARAARASCCKPDGGTCCPNARLRLDQPLGAVPGR